MTTLQHPARQAKLAKAEGRKLMGTCSLTLRINETHYSVRGFAMTQANWDRKSQELVEGTWAWELRKLGTGTARVIYTVAESPDGPLCDCPSFEHHGADRPCKHIRALTARGLIRPVAPAPRSGLDGPAFDAEAIDAADHAIGSTPFSKPYTAEQLDRLAEQMDEAAETRSIPWMAEDCRIRAREYRERAAGLRREAEVASPSKPVPSLMGVGLVRDELDGPVTPEAIERLADDCEGQAGVNEAHYPDLAARQRERAAKLRALADELKRDTLSLSKSVSDVTPASPPSFTLPDDIVAPDDEPFALASQSGVPATAEAPTGEYSPIVALLRGARERGLKYPSIEIRTPHGMPVVLKLCGGKSRYPGSVNVTNGIKFGEPKAEYFGRIDEWGRPHGNLTTYRPADPIEWGVVETLRRLAADPAAVAAEHGHATGRCCFCSRELTDPKSVQVGYGPICATRHALPWG
jgi:hypothetical protein